MPVLSVHITETPPSVSTELSLLTIALFLAILWTPRASEIVTIAGRPSGIAATASATATKNISAIVLPLKIPPISTAALTARQMIPIFLPTVFNSL